MANSNRETRLSGREVVHSLGQKLLCALGNLISPGTRVALVDFPFHDNCGDSAIWLGELQAIRTLHLDLVYQCDYHSFSARHLKDAVADGVVCLHGGGNLGDHWPMFQRFREHVIRSSPENRVIQLPQTIHFTQPQALRRAQEVFNAHPDLVLMVRDRQSQDFALNHFHARVVLAPDSALALGPLARPCPPVTSVQSLIRQDSESAMRPQQAPVKDWPKLSPLGTLATMSRNTLGRTVARLRTPPPPLLRALDAAFDRHARERVRSALATLAQGEVLITDRLHGHLLAVMLGIPHVLMDNSYGKNRAFFRQWTSQINSVRWADDMATATAHAQCLLRRAQPTATFR